MVKREDWVGLLILVEELHEKLKRAEYVEGKRKVKYTEERASFIKNTVQKFNEGLF